MVLGLSIVLLTSWSWMQTSHPTEVTRLAHVPPPPTLDCTIRVDYKQLIFDANTGMMYYQDHIFTGYSLKYYKNGQLKEKTHYTNGKRFGLRQMWYTDGTLSYQANFKNNKLDGKVKTWFANGQLRSESNYEFGIAHGLQQQWYASGTQFKVINLDHGQEVGLQKAWRENGKLYANYEAINGRIFGLKKANLCYSLSGEDLVLAE